MHSGDASYVILYSSAVWPTSCQGNAVMHPLHSLRSTRSTGQVLVSSSFLAAVEATSQFELTTDRLTLRNAEDATQALLVPAT